MRDVITLGLKGAAMGMAEVVPGVSGGTIAFVTGIYERLLESITAVGPGLVPIYKAGGIKAVWTEVQGGFLVNLLAGMLLGLVFGVFAISYLLEAYPPIVWSFFFGLILASVWYIGRMVAPWSTIEIGALLIGAGVALSIVMGSPASGNTALWFVFLSGVIAISALLLPGVSGSFILLLLGMYSYIVPTVKSALSGGGDGEWQIVFVFALGCITGLVTFSRVLSWLFAKYPQPTLALLTGFMFGSLYKLWPWRMVTAYLTDSSGAQVFDDEGLPKVISEIPVMPGRYLAEELGNPYVVLCLLAVLAGLSIVLLLARFDKSPAAHAAHD